MQKKKKTLSVRGSVCVCVSECKGVRAEGESVRDREEKELEVKQK